MSNITYKELTGLMLESQFQVDPTSGHIKYLTRHGNWRDAGWRLWNGYRKVSFPLGEKRYCKIPSHLLVWVWARGRWPIGEIDHINGDRADNRIENLREVTVAENRANKKIQSNNRIGFKWVTKFQNKYRAEIRKNGKRVYSSFHASPEEAYAAACEAARRIHGEFFNAG